MVCYQMTASSQQFMFMLGTIFDVSAKRNTYGPGCSYHCFTGKDASRALGLGSLKAEDLLADYSTLDSSQVKVLDDWYTFFSCVAPLPPVIFPLANWHNCRKRYNVVGRVIDQSNL